jgi:membrane-bound ClpP family serine protease
MKSRIKDWLLVLASFIDDAAVVALVFLILLFFNIQISWPVIIFLVIVFIASIYIIHRLIIPALHRRKVNGAEGMVGLVGKVVEPLNPNGLIKAEGEVWKARSINGPVAAGKKVRITGFEGLTLLVKPL